MGGILQPGIPYDGNRRFGNEPFSPHEHNKLEGRRIMSKLRIYGNPLSRTDRVLWMASELGLDFELVSISGAKGETRTPEFLAINPNGHIPVIQDEDLTLYESMAINLYLARKHGGPLMPVNLVEEAKALQWSFWVVTEVEGSIVRAARNIGAMPGDPVNMELVKAEFEKIQAPLKVLDDQLGKAPYLLGDRFTVADLNVAAVLSWGPIIGLDLTPQPNVAAWIKRCMARPAVPKKVIPGR
jgi:glutathione S-transferase